MSATLHAPMSFAPDAVAAPGAVTPATMPGNPAYRGVVGGVRLFFARKHAEFRLSCLSDRVLADIGITRESIPAVVRGNIRRG
jgi:uncharacterized protein YjiS (DUF1127 family)